MNLSPWRTPYQVWAEKTGIAEPEDISDKPRVEWGTRLEETIRQKFSESHPDLKVVREEAGKERIYTDVKRPWVMATLDGMLYRDKKPVAILECKTAHYPTSKEWGESGAGAAGVPVFYLTQIYHYMDVTGLQKAYCAVLIDGWDYREYEIDYDAEDVEAIHKKVDAFWKLNVEGGTAPEPKPNDMSLFAQSHPGDGELEDGTTEILKIIDKWQDAKGDAMNAKASTEYYALRLKKALGDAKGYVFPEGRLTWVRGVGKKTDYKAMRDDDPVLVAAYEDLKNNHTTHYVKDMGLRWKDAE